jgi:hypothetical protein
MPQKKGDGREFMVHQNIDAGVEAIRENVAVIRAKFRPLLEAPDYPDNVAKLVTVIPQMLTNMEAMAGELNNAFNILNEAQRTGDQQT